MSKKGLDCRPGPLRLGAGRYWDEDLESRRLAGLAGRSCGGTGQNGMGVMLTAGFGCPATLASTTPLLFCTTWNNERERGKKATTTNEDLVTRELKVDDTSGLPCVFYLQEWSFFKPPETANSLSTEDEDPAPAMGSLATVTACMSQVKKVQTWFVVDLYFIGSNTLSLTPYFRRVIFFFWISLSLIHHRSC